MPTAKPQFALKLLQTVVLLRHADGACVSLQTVGISHIVFLHIRAIRHHMIRYLSMAIFDMLPLVKRYNGND